MSSIAVCPAGKQLIGGGFTVLGSVGDAEGDGPRVLSNRKWNGESWLVQTVVPNDFVGRQYSVFAYAHCVNP